MSDETAEPPPADAPGAGDAPAEEPREWRAGWVRKQIRASRAKRQLSAFGTARAHARSGGLDQLIVALFPWQGAEYRGQRKAVCAVLGRDVMYQTLDVWRAGRAPADVLRVMLAAGESRLEQLQAAVVAVRAELAQAERKPSRAIGYRVVGPDGRDRRGNMSRGRFEGGE